MNWKYSLTLILAVCAVGLLGLILSGSGPNTDLSGKVTAGSPKDGLVVPGSDGKVKVFDNGVYSVEPAAFAVSPRISDIEPPDPETAAKMSLEPRSFREKRRKNKEIELSRERAAKGLPPMTQEERKEREINDLNRRRIKTPKPGSGLGDKDFVDPLVKNQANASAPEVMPTPSLSFDGAGQADNATVGEGAVTPPDTNGDVGLSHYVSSVNLVLKIFNKNGTVAAAPVKTSDLWLNLPPTDPCRVFNDGDPIVLYDQLADRWHISQFAVPGFGGIGVDNFQCVAVSTTSDPTGSYYTWSYLYPGNLVNDYPKVSVWSDAYHMTFNQFTNGGIFSGMGFLSQDRPKALAGDPTAGVVYRNIAPIDPNAGGALPLDIEGFVPPPAGLPVVIGEFRSTTFGDPLDAIRFYKWEPNFASPGSSTVTVLPDVAIAAFDARNPSGRGDIEQSGTAVGLDSIGDRLMHRLTYRNLGTYAAPINSIVGSFTVNVSGVNPTTAATYQSAVRWLELRRTGDSFSVAGDTFSVFDQGTHNLAAVSGTGANNWMSSIAQDNQGNLALGFSQSGPTQFPDIKTAGRTGGVQGTMNEGEAVFHAAGGSQTSSSNRWGDYSSMNLDPVDDCTFWYTQQYYSATSAANWSTRVGAFKFPSCAAAPKGTISGTITGCSSGLPIDDASVLATGGFHRLTIANGTYSMAVTPGNYTVSANKAPGFFGSDANTSVINGGNSVVNICLTGVPVLSGGTLSITAESCGLPNTLPDPGETLTVSLPIINNGGANTTNVVATLRNTGGVINAGAGQAYGAIATGGGSVSRNFSFRVQPGLTCGSPITLTWDLQDGPTNLGTLVKAFNTGVPVINLTQNFDGVTAPALPAGWVQNQTTGTGITWTTSATGPDSAPNAAFANEPVTIQGAALESPSFNVASAAAKLTFRNNFDTEPGFDGMVLDIKIGAGAWQDILTAGGSFVTGGYNATISSGFGSPIAGRQAWSGSSSGYTNVEVNLPPTANGQSVQVRWLMASDEGVGGVGVRIDNVVVTAGVACQGPCAPLRAVRADIDGDGRTDHSIYRPVDSTWWALRSTDGVGAVQWGIAGDTPFAGDFSGDKETDLGIFRPAVPTATPDFWLLNTDNFTFDVLSWGLPGDIPFSGDYNNDGRSDVSVYRPSENIFYISISRPAPADKVFTFGEPGDKPLSGDFDGDGQADVAVYRPSIGTWFYADATGNPATSWTAVQFGLPTDLPVHADYDGDGADDIAVYRPNTGQWFIFYSDTATVAVFQWGNSTDKPVPGDYDGDGKYDIGIYRSGEWWVFGSTAGAMFTQWGIASDMPLPAMYIP